MARAAETAKEVAKFRPSVPLRFVKELRERSFGPYEGKGRSEAGLHDLSWHVIAVLDCKELAFLSRHVMAMKIAIYAEVSEDVESVMNVHGLGREDNTGGKENKGSKAG